jgi:hypothetical protein
VAMAAGESKDNGRSSSNGRAGRERGTAAGMYLGLEPDSIPTCPFGGTDGHLAPSIWLRRPFSELDTQSGTQLTTGKWTDNDNRAAVWRLSTQHPDIKNRKVLQRNKRQSRDRAKSHCAGQLWACGSELRGAGGPTALVQASRRHRITLRTGVKSGTIEGSFGG